jgi:soluble lytic murein transglycosylase-like protein
MNLTNHLQTMLFQLMTSLQDRQSAQVEKPRPVWVHPGLDPEYLSQVDQPPKSKKWTSFEQHIEEASRKYRIPTALVRAVIKAESNGNPRAVSRSGAQGLMQLMPATARSLGVKNPFNPRENINGGVKLLRQLMNRYQGNLDKVLAAYNAGTVAVDRYEGIPPYRETQVYVPRVKKYLQQEQSWEV